MVKISKQDLYEAVYQAIDKIACEVEDSCCDMLLNMQIDNKNCLSAKTLEIIKENIQCAKEKHIPVCQDTGMCIIFLKIGQNIFFDYDLKEVLDNAVNDAYKGLRNSFVEVVTRDPISKQTPYVLHQEFIKGDDLIIEIMLKGFGSENMSKVFLLEPHEGVDGIKSKVIDCIKKADSSPCPPIIVGVGIGGTFEKAAIMAKHALFRKIGSKNSNNNLADLEMEIKTLANKLNIGIAGFREGISVMDVFIEEYPTHIASIPLAVNICCHLKRETTIHIKGV